MSLELRLFVTANGTQLEFGDGSEQYAKLSAFDGGVKTAREASSGMASGQRTHQPFSASKALDAGTPLLFKALCNNEVIEGRIELWGPDATGSGVPENREQAKQRARARRLEENRAVRCVVCA